MPFNQGNLLVTSIFLLILGIVFRTCFISKQGGAHINPLELRRVETQSGNYTQTIHGQWVTDVPARSPSHLLVKSGNSYLT